MSKTHYDEKKENKKEKLEKKGIKNANATPKKSLLQKESEFLKDYY
jgi:hypothetical protein